jgi:hypothetical protein
MGFGSLDLIIAGLFAGVVLTGCIYFIAARFMPGLGTERRARNDESSEYVNGPSWYGARGQVVREIDIERGGRGGIGDDGGG